MVSNFIRISKLYQFIMGMKEIRLIRIQIIKIRLNSFHLKRILQFLMKKSQKWHFKCKSFKFSFWKLFANIEYRLNELIKYFYCQSHILDSKFRNIKSQNVILRFWKNNFMLIIHVSNSFFYESIFFSLMNSVKAWNL